MPGPRRERFAEAVVHLLSALIQKEVRDPRVGFVTLTAAEVSPDLRQARIFVTVLGPKKMEEDSLQALNGAAGFLQRGLFKEMQLRRPLQLTFVLDRSTVEGSRIEKLLGQIREQGEGEEEE